MHTATQLAKSHFSVQLNDAAADVDKLFPAWQPHDRFAIVVLEPFGALGASLLIQAAITLHFDAVPARRGSMPVYPEIYAIHVGGRFGDLSPFDFWPGRKEVFVENDPLAVLSALNDRAITRLAVPDTTANPVDFSRLASAGWSEHNSALERITSAFAYSDAGRVSSPDVTVTGLDPATEINSSFTLDPQASLDTFGGLSSQDFSHMWDSAEFDTQVWLQVIAARIAEQPAQVRERAVENRRALMSGGLVTESYRRVSADEALSMLVRD
jgi:hypothetical protein